MNLSIKKRKHVWVVFRASFFSIFFVMTEMAFYELGLVMKKMLIQRAGCSGLLAPDIIKTRTRGTMYIHCKRKKITLDMRHASGKMPCPLTHIFCDERTIVLGFTTFFGNFFLFNFLNVHGDIRSKSHNCSKITAISNQNNLCLLTLGHVPCMRSELLY